MSCTVHGTWEGTMQTWPELWVDGVKESMTPKKYRTLSLEQKKQLVYSGYPGGLKAHKYSRMIETHPERIIEQAVRRMLPKSKLGRDMFRRLKVYAGNQHPHTNQNPEALAC